MNKKTYIAPAVEVIEMEYSGMICTSGVVDENFEPGGSGDPEGGEDMNNSKSYSFDIWE